MVCKLVFVVLFQKVKLEVYEAEVWNTVLKDDSDTSVPSIAMFEEKVYSDSKVSILLFSNYRMLLTSNLLQKFFQQQDQPNIVLLRICKTARTLQLYKDSYNSKAKATDELDYNDGDDDSIATEDDDCSYTQFLNSDGPPKKQAKRKQTRVKCPPQFKRKADLQKVTIASPNYANSDITSFDGSTSSSMHKSLKV